MAKDRGLAPAHRLIYKAIHLHPSCLFLQENKFVVCVKQSEYFTICSLDLRTFLREHNESLQGNSESQGHKLNTSVLRMRTFYFLNLSLQK